METKKIKKILEKDLSRFRYQHSLGVARLAKMLAERHGWDPEKAELAGLLHDCAKEWKPKKLIKYVVKKKLQVPNFDFIKETSPNLLHAYVGAAYAKKKKWTLDPQVLSAIRSHTLGDLKMKVHQKILFVADYAAFGRKFPGVTNLRALALKDLESGFKAVLQNKILHSLSRHKSIHPFAIRVWNEQMTQSKSHDR